MVCGGMGTHTTKHNNNVRILRKRQNVLYWVGTLQYIPMAASSSLRQYYVIAYMLCIVDFVRFVRIMHPANTKVC